MEDKVKGALEYAEGSNNLEDAKLTKDEIEKIMSDVKSGKTDESFLYYVYRTYSKNNRQNENTEGGKTYRKSK